MWPTLQPKQSARRGRFGPKLPAWTAQFGSYLIVGGLAFLLDAGLLVALTELADMPYLRSAAIGFLAGLTLNYALSKMWVFRTAPANRGAEFVVYAGIGVVGLGTNQALMWLLTDRAGLQYGLSKCCAAVAVVLWTFLARKRALAA